MISVDPLQEPAVALGMAGVTRRFILAPDASPDDLLEHLNLLDDGRVTDAAILLFGKQPQRFLISSEIKCAHFHGTEVAKPIPSYQVYKGTVFDLVDAAVDFVLVKIPLSVGDPRGRPAGPGALRDPRRGGGGGDRERGRPPRLHEQRQRPGDALCRPASRSGTRTRSRRP